MLRTCSTEWQQAIESFILHSDTVASVVTTRAGLATEKITRVSGTHPCPQDGCMSDPESSRAEPETKITRSQRPMVPPPSPLWSQAGPGVQVH